AVFAINEVVDHATLDRARPVERIQSGEILDRIRLVTAQHVAHAARFKLEHAGCESLVKYLLISSLIVELQAIEGDALSPGLRDELHSVIENGEGGQAQEVHLQQ